MLPAIFSSPVNGGKKCKIRHAVANFAAPAANLPHESGATKAAAEESVPIQNSFGPGFTSQLSSPLSPPLLAPGRPYSPTTTTYDTTTTHHYHPPPTITMAAAASPSYLRSSSNNTPAVKLHPPAANRLYFTWLPLNYFFTSWFSVGAPPTPLVAIGRCQPPSTT